jgi:poly(hydroxyalkanoate) depolymerase family esterase
VEKTKQMLAQLWASAKQTRAGRWLAALPPGVAATVQRVWGWFVREPALEQPLPRATVVEGRPGQFVSGFYSCPAGTRPYKLYVPTAYIEQALPLVVMLHGCHQGADTFANGTRMNALAEEWPCLVLYPEQTHTANRHRCWNWFKRGHQRRGQGEPAILADMTREVMRRYRVDPAKVYVAGLSAGGAMAAVLGTAYPDLYAAVCVHSGLASGSAHDLPSALVAMYGLSASKSGDRSTLATPSTPTIVFHGDRDKTVHPRNSEQLVSRSLEQSGAASADAAIEQGQVPGGHSYTRAVHRDSKGRVVLEYWRVHGAGHAWFGGSLLGSYTDPQGPDATREMMRFFTQSGMKQRPYDHLVAESLA